MLTRASEQCRRHTRPSVLRIGRAKETRDLLDSPFDVERAAMTRRPLRLCCRNENCVEKSAYRRGLLAVNESIKHQD